MLWEKKVWGREAIQTLAREARSWSFVSSDGNIDCLIRDGQVGSFCDHEYETCVIAFEQDGTGDGGRSDEWPLGLKLVFSSFSIAYKVS